MKYTITDEPHEVIELQPDYGNQSISLIQKKRVSTMHEWAIKVVILNKREALLVHRAISDVMLAPQHIYQVVKQGG